MTIAPAPAWWARLPLIGNLGHPLALKEVRAFIRRGRFLWSQFFYLAVLTIGVIIVIATTHGSSTRPEEISRRVFMVFFVIQNILVYLIFPAFAATSISGERVEKSFDLLITTDLKPAEIVWGKFIGVFGGCCYFLLVTLPVLGTCILFGGVSPLQALEYYMILLIQAALVTMYGVLVSSASQNNNRAVLGAYLLSSLVGFFATAGIIGFFEENVAGSLLLIAKSWPPGALSIVLWTTTYVLISIFLLCFLVAVQRLTSPEGNRSTPIRVFVLLNVQAAIFIVLIVADLLLQQGGGLSWSQRIRFVLTCGVLSSVLLTFCALAMAADQVATPLRVVRDAGRHRIRYALAWVFLPGGCRGIAYAVLLLALALLGMETLAMFRFDLDRHWSEQLPGHNAMAMLRMIWYPIASGIFAYASFAFLLSALGLRGVLNLAIVIGCAILATFYALPFLMMETEPRWIHLYPFSLLVCLSQFTDGKVEPIVTSMQLHFALGVLGTLGGCLALRLRGIPILVFQRPKPA